MEGKYRQCLALHFCDYNKPGHIYYDKPLQWCKSFSLLVNHFLKPVRLHTLLSLRHKCFIGGVGRNLSGEDAEMWCLTITFITNNVTSSNIPLQSSFYFY